MHGHIQEDGFRKQSSRHAWTLLTKRIIVEASNEFVRMQSGGELTETIKGALRTAAPLEPNHGWVKAWT